MKTCPQCLGMGELSPMDADYDVWDLCDMCDGAGTIPGVALVHVRWMGSELLTYEYVHARLSAAHSFVDGWHAAFVASVGEDRADYHPCPYTSIRDYLVDFDVDYLLACELALYLTSSVIPYLTIVL